jgi:SAM-dependent methyltransferase
MIAPDRWIPWRTGQYCPVCERRVGAFDPLPAQYERDARKYGYAHFGRGETINVAAYSCPHCRASDRERLYALFIDEVVAASGFERGRKLIHFAPEGALSGRIRRLGAFDYRTADRSMPGTDDRIDLTATPYADRSVDAFICSHVLEHIPDDRAAMRELHRILVPGGWGIVMVPLMTHFEHSVEDPAATTEAERWRLFGQGDHVRLYAKADFLARLAEAGFSVRQLGVAHFGQHAFARCGITPHSVLYVVSRD